MITLHIEDTTIKLIQIKGRQIEKAATLPIESGLVENGVVLNKTLVSQLIKQLISSQGIADKQVIASINGIHAIYRTVSVPHLTKNMVDEAAQHELARAMPVSLSEVYTSWQAIDISPQETLFCMVGIPKNTIDSLLDTLRQADLQVTGMDITPLALARIPDEKDAIIINIQSSNFDIVVTVNGIPELLRTLTFPSQDISKEEKNKLVKDELDRTITFYNSSHKENPLGTNTATYITGEMSETVAASLPYQIKTSPIWFSSPSTINSSEYTINIGLALKQIKDSKIAVQVNIDSRPTIYLPKPRPVLSIVSWAALGLAVIILVPLILITQKATAETSALSAKINATETQVKSRQPTNVYLKLLETNVDIVESAENTYEATLDTFAEQHKEMNSNLNKITSLLTGTMNLTSISYGENIYVNGNAPDKDTILNYTKALRDTNLFSNVIISDMHEVDYNLWAFVLILE